MTFWLLIKVLSCDKDQVTYCTRLGLGKYRKLIWSFHSDYHSIDKTRWKYTWFDTLLSTRTYKYKNVTSVTILEWLRHCFWINWDYSYWYMNLLLVRLLKLFVFIYSWHINLISVGYRMMLRLLVLAHNWWKENASSHL